jgi:spermidine/putrescine transport system permease protein
MKLSLLTIMLGHGTALISVATTEIFAGLQKLDRSISAPVSGGPSGA